MVPGPSRPSVSIWAGGRRLPDIKGPCDLDQVITAIPVTGHRVGLGRGRRQGRAPASAACNLASDGPGVADQPSVDATDPHHGLRPDPAA